MNTRPHPWISGLIAGCVLMGTLAGQDKPAKTPERPRFDAVPTILNPTVAAVGPRLNTKGKERTVLQGQYRDEFGEAYSVQIVQQLPNLVSLDGFGRNAATLKFDGTAKATRKSPAEEALLETFVADTCEGMLASIQKGAAVRLLGRFFKPNPKEYPDYKGAGFDIYEVTGPVTAVADQPVRMKFYLFDSTSGLLVTTRYTDTTVARGKTVEVRFSNWQRVEGSAYAGRIDRYENSRLVFSIAMTGVSNGARVDATTFSDALTTK